MQADPAHGSQISEPNRHVTHCLGVSAQGAKRASSGSLPRQADLTMQQLAAPPPPRQANARLQSALCSRGTPPDQAPPLDDPHVSAARSWPQEVADADPMWLDILEGLAGDAESTPDEVLTWPLWLPHQAAPALQPALSWPADGMQSPFSGEGPDAHNHLFRTADPAAGLQPVVQAPPVTQQPPGATSVQSAAPQHTSGTRHAWMCLSCSFLQHS